MADLPPPLVPPECSMAGNDWFPLYFQRLRKSKWWRRASDLARARNVMLWGEAYQSTPAGSLPDDDDDLAEAAGFGMDVDGFLRAKAEIMSPWVLCSDGRWYHPTTCEVVLEAWEKVGERRKKEAAKKAAQRAKVRGVPEKTTEVPRDIANVPGDNPEKTGVSPRVPAQTEQTGEDSRDAIASLSSADDVASPINETKYPDLFEAAWKAYPHVRGRSSKPKALGFWRRIPQAHRQALPSAAARFARDGREPKADCGAPGMHLWIRDAKYADWLADDANPGPDIPAMRFPGPPEIRAAAVARMGESWARGYLDKCGWRDVPQRAVVTTSATIAGRLQREIGPDLRALGVTVIEEKAA